MPAFVLVGRGRHGASADRAILLPCIGKGTTMARLLRALTLMLLLLAWLPLAQAGELSPSALKAAKQQGQVRVLVMLHDQAPPSALRDNVLRKRAVADKVGAVLSRMGPGGTVKRRFALVPAFAVVADAATLQRLASDPLVARIDIDAPGRGHAAPDEASVLNRVNTLPEMGYGGAGMKVAVIDSGVDTDHADFASRLVGQQCFCSNAGGVGGCCPNGQATQSGAGSAEDAHGHGTNVAGIIVGQGTVSRRGAQPGAQLVAVRVLDANNNFCCSSDVVAAMDWVAANHPDVDVVNMSLGTSALFAGDCDTQTSFTQAMATAVNALVARGAVVTASSGNAADATAMGAPACARNAFSVGATWDFTGGTRTFLSCTESATAPRQPACFTNRSTTTDLYAAGAFVTAPGVGGGESTFGGTSQAAPMAAGCALALKQAAPASTVAQREEAMRLSPTRVTDTVSGRSYPFLDCVDAISLLRPQTGPVRYDVTGDRKADVFWRHRATGGNDVWRSASAASRQPTASVTLLSWQAVGLGDFNGDGKADVLWRNATSGANDIWLSAVATTRQAIAAEAIAWRVAGVGDFNGDGRDDIFWRHASTGQTGIWPSGNRSLSQAQAQVANLDWQVVGVGDFNGDGKADVLWRNLATGANELWRSGRSQERQGLTAVTVLSWSVAGVGDVNGDGRADVVWRNGGSGANTAWLSANVATQQPMTTVADANWRIAAVADYTGDGRADVFWRHAGTGHNELWRSASSAQRLVLARVADANWGVVR
jgi:hypothetical protein